MAETNPHIPATTLVDDPVFAQVANRYLDNTLTPAELESFNAALRSDLSKRMAFKWLCLTHCALARELDEHEQFQLQLLKNAVDAGDEHPVDLNDVAILPAVHENPDDPSDEEPVYDAPPSIPLPTAEKPKKKWYWAAGLLAPLAIAGWYVLRSGPAKSMALIDTSLDARWVSPQDVNLQAGSALPAGTHKLIAGVIKLKMKGKNEVVLQGPSEFEVVAESVINLSRGKLCARMGAEHVHLTVNAPDLKAVDLGTEFAVDVAEGASTHLEVFEGAVEADGNGPGSNTMKLTANQAVRVTAGSNQIRKDQPTPTAFLRTAEVDSLAANLKPGVDDEKSAVVSLGDTDIGTPQTPGQSAYYSGVWKVSADGRGFQAAQDQFHFARTPVSGNGEIIVQLVRSARLSQNTELPPNAPKIAIRTSAEDPESAFVATHTLIAGMQPLHSSSGIMLRNSEDPGSPFVAVVMTGGAGVELIYRDSSGEAATLATKTPHTYAPIWLKLERVRDLWSAWSSDDGVVWTPRGTCMVSLSKDLLAGLAVSSATDNVMTSALFSHLSVSGWTKDGR